MAAAAPQVVTLGVDDISDMHPLAFTSSYICNGTTFHILVIDNPPEGYDRDSTEVCWTEELCDISMHDGTDPNRLLAQSLLLQRLANDIKTIVLPKMLELAPPVAELPPQSNGRKKVQNVQEHLFPEVVKLQLVSRDGRFEVIEGHHTDPPLEELKPIAHRELQAIGFEDISSFPTYPASEILLLSRCVNGNCAQYATDLGQTETFVCKLAYEWYRNSFVRELGMFAKIQKAKASLGLKARVSTLKALVTYKDGIVGMLIDKIPTRFDGLSDVVHGKVHVPLSLRKKWAVQIEDTVNELHRNGIVWGDAKPSNVIVDEVDNAVVIDFG